MGMTAFLVLLGFVGGALLLSWGYFSRYALRRPPLGVFNLVDIALTLGGVIVVPYLYLALPLWLVAGLLGVAALSALLLLWEPLLRRGWAAWPAALLPLGLAVLLGGRGDALSYGLNNLLLLGVVVGLSNLWAQSGLRARDAAILGGALALYDFVATSLLPLTGELFVRLAGLPLAPLLAWPLEGGRWLGLGLGDLLLAALFPLVMRKAFGRLAGLLALGSGLAVCLLLLALPLLGLLQGVFPVMLLLGPLMVLQYACWRRGGRERSTWEFRQAEPTRA